MNTDADRKQSLFTKNRIKRSTRRRSRLWLAVQLDYPAVFRELHVSPPPRPWKIGPELLAKHVRRASPVSRRAAVFALQLSRRGEERESLYRHGDRSHPGKWVLKHTWKPGAVFPQPWGFFAGNPVFHWHKLLAGFLFDTFISYPSLIIFFSVPFFFFHRALFWTYQIKSNHSLFVSHK